ncbi:MAG TPA: SDR family oxidoreductase [Bryobacteraceae bacterium]|nr:SDR family oxidoreductase [Bryobacteraceae bacterium]
MTALVTGAGRGIGRAIAQRLSQDGWAVAITARSEGEIEETAKLCAGSTATFAGDIAEPAFVQRLVQHVEHALGPISLLVNNAGSGGPFGPFWETDPAEWWRCQEVNLRGPMLCCREVLPGMVVRSSGRIVNVVSGAACQAYPDMSAYVASKTALLRFSEQLAVELKPHGVSVFPIRPGLVRTRMVEEGRHQLPFIQKMLDDGLEVAPEVVASLVATLASGQADALSGRLFQVREDLDSVLRQAEDVQQRELYLLRLHTL